MDSKREKNTGCGIMGGIGLIVVGLFVGMMFAAGGSLRFTQSGGRDIGMVVLAVLGPIMILAGLALIAGCIIYGFAAAKRQGSKAMENHRDVLVVARFAMNEIGEMVFQDFDPDDPDTKLFVQLKFPGGRNAEFRCRIEVFDRCCEGMRGTAITKGDWLGGFSAFPVQPRTPLI
jgi:hypothetical protein